MTVRVIHADCRTAITELVAEGTQVDAIITDPPYGLEFMGKTWDAPLKLWETGAGFAKPGIGDRDTPWPAFGAFGAANPTCATCGGRARGAKKCSCSEPAWKPIGKRRGAVVPEGDVPTPMEAYQSWCETWTREALSILRPGGFLLAFGGTRTEHRLACAIEDAGFAIEDKFLWVHGQGFPKNRNLLKPACEVITIAYRPGGARRRQVDECRIDGPMDGSWGNSNATIALEDGRRMFNASPGAREYRTEKHPDGRWPTNFAHDGSDEVLAGFPDSAGQQGDIRGTEPSTTGDNGIYGHFGRVPFTRRAASTTGRRSAQSRAATVEATEWGTDNNESREYPGDSGSAARFFYAAKADREDRWGSRHPTVKPVELIKHLVALHCPLGGLFLDCFAGSGTAGVAALATGRNAILIEEDADHIVDIRERMAFYEGEGRHSLVSKNRNAGSRDKPGPLL